MRADGKNVDEADARKYEEALARAAEREEFLLNRIEMLEKELAAENALGEPSVLVGSKKSASAGDSDDALIDPDTDLFSEGYFRVALDARIAAARRRLRPVSVVLIRVCRDIGEPGESEGELPAIANAIRSTLREADTASRMSDGRFGLILEDTPENGAIWTVDRLRSELLEKTAGHTVWAGIACYPAHAFETAEILERATTALEQAQEWRQDRTEIAAAD